jgi:fructose-specific phosphotransferase system component IIB
MPPACHPLAAAALEKAAKALGHTIKVETQGSVGAKNQLTPEDIAEAGMPASRISRIRQRISKAFE